MMKSYKCTESANFEGLFLKIMARYKSSCNVLYFEDKHNTDINKKLKNLLFLAAYKSQIVFPGQYDRIW